MHACMPSPKDMVLFFGANSRVRSKVFLASGVDPLVPVGRPLQEHHPGVRRDRDTGDDDVLGGLPRQVLSWRLVADRLLDELFDHLGMLAEMALQSRKLVEHVDDVGQQRGGCITGRGQDQVARPSISDANTFPCAGR